MTRTFVVVTLLMVMTPAAAAWPWDPLEIRVRELHVGDLWRVSSLSPEGEAVVEQVYHVEGPARAVDRFGTEHATVAFRTDSYLSGELERAYRCYRIEGVSDLVRRELLAGWDSYSSSTGSVENMLGGGTYTEENQTVVVSFEGGCGKLELFAGRVFREGDRINIRELFPEETGREALSDPGERTSFDGRDAISFTFWLRDLWEPDRRAGDLPADARFVAVFADGLPAPASYRLVGGSPEAGQGNVLTGFTPGDGPIVAPPGDARIPERNRDAAWKPYDARMLDDAALGLPFPYAEAYGALLADLRAGGKAWLEAHPGAFLTWAHYTPSGADGETVGITGRGSWWLAFRDGDTVATWTISAVDAATTPVLSYRLPAAHYDIVGGDTFEEQWPAPTLPTETIPSATILSLARSAGVDDIAPRLSYVHIGTPFGPSYHAVHLTEIDGTEDEVGRAVGIDMSIGGVAEVYAASFDSTTTPGLLSGGGPARVDAAIASSIAPLPIPASLAGGAVAGLALLALLVKLVLLPLFTRLRRDRLLDNPVRARLYDRIRAEPGIHLAELEEFLGIGKGATKHHVDQLASHKLVFVLEVAGYSRCYASGHVPIDVARRMGVLRAGSHARVYDLYATKPTLSLREAARELGMSAPSVHRAKKRLEKEGLLPAASEATIRV